MLLTKKEIFERLKKEGIDLGKNPFRTFLYYQETGLIPNPEGKRKNAFLFPEHTVESVKCVYNLQKGGESIAQIKKNHKYNSVNFENQRRKKLEETIILVDKASKNLSLDNNFNALVFFKKNNYLPNIDGIDTAKTVKIYGELVANIAIMWLITTGDILESIDIKKKLLELSEKKTA